MPNFISIRIFERFFKENLNFIINSFQIKHCSFKKNGGISAKSSRNIGKKRPGPARRNFGPERPGPAQFVKPEIYNPDPDIERSKIFESHVWRNEIFSKHLHIKH